MENFTKNSPLMDWDCIEVKDTNIPKNLRQSFQEVDKRRATLAKVDEFWGPVRRIGTSKPSKGDIARAIAEIAKRNTGKNYVSSRFNSIELLTITDDDSIYSPQIEKAIESSKFILKLEENWDEDGGSTYTEETWKNATQFVRRTALLHKNNTGKWTTPPKITPGPDGSIDVRWKNPNRSILINFPADSSVPPDFFGTDKHNDTIKGTLNLSSQNHWLLQWLNR